jgi:hypothetical protein
MPMQNGGDIVIELSVLLPERQDGNADDGKDEPRSLHVLAQTDGKLLIRVGLG